MRAIKQHWIAAPLLLLWIVEGTLRRPAQTRQQRTTAAASIITSPKDQGRSDITNNGAKGETIEEYILRLSNRHHQQEREPSSIVARQQTREARLQSKQQQRRTLVVVEAPVVVCFPVAGFYLTLEIPQSEANEQCGPASSVCTMGACSGDGTYDLNGEILDADRLGGDHYSGVTHVALSHDGLTLVLGEVAHDMNEGRVRVFHRTSVVDGTMWTMKGSVLDATPPSMQQQDRIGVDVDVNRDGSIVALSRYNFDGSEISEGALEIYQFNDTIQDWQLMGDVFQGGQAQVLLGRHMALSADGYTVAYAAPLINNSSGLIYVNQYDPTTHQWQLVGQPISTIPDGMLGNLDLQLSSDGDIVMFSVGINAVDVFQYDGSVWSRRNGVTTVSDTMIDDFTTDTGGEDLAFFGSSLAMSGDASRIAIAESKTPGMADTTGFVHIYFWNETTLEYDHHNYLQGWHNESNCGIGLAFDGTGDTLAMGCSNLEADEDGGVLVFRWAANGYPHPVYQLWQIIKDDGIDNNEAGTQVALSGDGNTLAVSTTLNHHVLTYEYTL